MDLGKLLEISEAQKRKLKIQSKSLKKRVKVLEEMNEKLKLSQKIGETLCRQKTTKPE